MDMEIHSSSENLVNQVTLAESLKMSCSTGSYADMVLQCSDGFVRAHKSVLAAASSFLRSIFEKYDPIETNLIMLPEVKTTTMNQALLILYTGQTVSPKREDFADVILTLKMLGVCNDFKKGWEIFEATVQFPPIDKTSSEDLISKPKEINEVEVSVEKTEIADDEPLNEVEVSIEKTEIAHDEPLILTEIKPKFPTRRLKVRNAIRKGGSQQQYVQVKNEMHSPNERYGYPGEIHLLPNFSKPMATHTKSQTSKPINRTNGPFGKKISAETASVIKEMLESGQLQLTTGSQNFGIPAPSSQGRKNRIQMQQPVLKSRNPMLRRHPQEWSESAYLNRSGFSNKRPIPMYDEENLNIPFTTTAAPKRFRQNVMMSPPETFVHPPIENESEAHGYEYEPFIEEVNQENDYASNEDFDDDAGTSGIEIDPNVWNSMLIDYVESDYGIEDNNQIEQEYVVTTHDSEEPDYTLTPGEILEGQIIATQKDHAYANFGNTSKFAKAPKPKVKKPKSKVVTNRTEQ